MAQRINPIQILRGSNMDPYILNKRPYDPYDKGNIRQGDGLFVQTLEDYLADFVTSGIPYEQVTDYREKIQHRCIAVIEYGIYLYQKNLTDRVEKLYLPAIEKGAIPDDWLYKRYAEELRFEDEERLERFFTEAIRKAVTYLEKNTKHEALFNKVASLKAEDLHEFLSNLNENDKTALKKGLFESLNNAILRIQELYMPAIKAGNIPDSSAYNQRMVELGIQDRDELKEKLFYFLRNALCLTNWNDDDALRTDERAFRSCID